MLIRFATRADIPAIMSIVKAVVPLMQAIGNYQWDDTYPNPEVFERDIRLNQLWVAIIYNSVAGVSAITTDQDEEYRQVGWDINEDAIVTHRLAVDPAYSGKGIAAALLMKAEDEALRRGIKLLRVDTNSNNQATQKLFPKLGYEFAGEIGLNFRPGLRFYCYQKKL
ncbi:GNAT family N-acetyltransferase [Mucilaginibacter terrenus]|uniref:GNAT family N-acetyltransferase n=1 Tax=Mucilaginibacter terrenus TaxID=2482727 RepID=A0A3E2NXD4_9SPHI|nr:GNAT family N-acetyltransferase [Mucilaginibacter terrenus]RFZ85678.1 GNAT family N-acetyltransferase [Mucilaginibacter terrenus]